MSVPYCYPGWRFAAGRPMWGNASPLEITLEMAQDGDRLLGLLTKKAMASMRLAGSVTGNAHTHAMLEFNRWQALHQALAHSTAGFEALVSKDEVLLGLAWDLAAALAFITERERVQIERKHGFTNKAIGQAAMDLFAYPL